MDSTKNYFAQLLLKVKIYESNGNLFEQVFSNIKSLQNPNFKQVKPQGIFGDGKNDGYNKDTGEYYQVFGPENPSESINSAISKLKSDFEGLKEQWDELCKIRKWYFVINDKFLNLHTSLHKELLTLQKENKEIDFNLYQATDLLNDFLTLTQDQMMTIVGIIPECDNLKTDIEDQAFKEVLSKIDSFELDLFKTEKLNAPNYNNKIKFNHLSEPIKEWLSKSDFHYTRIEQLFKINPSYRGVIKGKLRHLYFQSRDQYKDVKLENNDVIFASLFHKIAVELNTQPRFATLCLLSYFFIRCDIFEDPENVNAE